MPHRERYVAVSPLLVPVDKTFDYSVPPELSDSVTAGSMVVVPFGGRRIFGMVVRITDIKPDRKLKQVESIVDDFKTVPYDLLGLCLWISKMYLCPLNAVMETVFPFQRKMSSKGIDNTAFMSLKQRTMLEKNVVVLEEALERAEADNFAELSRSPAQRRALRALIDEGGNMTARALVRIAGTSMQTLKELEKKGLVAIDYAPRDMSPAGDIGDIESHFKLNPLQQAAYDRICAALQPPRHEVYLLQGVSGSGKTEIYMHAVRCCVGHGRKVIILVPEIALATQIISRFLRRFAGRIAIWHSSLSMTERLFEWNRIVSGEADIVIGARSAVFAPLENVGLIIVDEEHESAYKQESRPRYHARDCAIQRAKLIRCPVVLGSATPSLESVYSARHGRFQPLQLPQRITGSALPDIAIVDMRKVKTERTTSLFSPRLVNAVADNLEKNEQSIIFLNHRGYAQYLQCFRCGEPLKCPLCSVNMKYHRLEKLMKCHICGHSEPPPDRCPSCGASKSALRYYGFGTERVMNQLKRKFRAARVERMDRDTVTRKGEYRRIITAFEEREIDILVGTQMVAKGLDFPGVTLVGVVSADSIINMPDFRSGERTFQLITQVAGRAGRRDVPGRVIIQTLNPNHPAIRAAADQNDAEFYDYELKIRGEAHYPPFTRIINFIVSSENENEAAAVAGDLVRRLEHFIKQRPGDQYFGLLGPAEAPFFKMHGRYRYFAFMRGSSIKELLAVAAAAFDSLPRENQKLTAIDVDPQNML